MSQSCLQALPFSRLWDLGKGLLSGMLQEARGWAASSPAFTPSGLVHPHPTTRVSSAVLFRQGAGPVLPSAAAGERQR